LIVSPNPFSKLTTVSFGVGHSAESALGGITLKIYDASGRLVKDFFLSTTYYLLPTAVSWDGTDQSDRQLPSGVYFVQLSVGDHLETRQVLLIR